MKIRKLFALLMAALLLTGCGYALAEAEQGTVENQFTLSASTEDRGVKSAVITFDAEKICISDRNRNATAYTYFDYIGDANSTLFVSCYADTSVEELYQETATKGFSKKMQEHITLSELKESTIGDLTVFTNDVFYKGELREKHFFIELDNGYILHNGSGWGYEGNVDFEEMLASVFTKVESGDGTRIRPSWGFEKENDGSALKYTFDSGNVFTLDYAEDVVEVGTAGSEIDVEYLDEAVNDNLSLEVYVSKKFDSLEAYQAVMEEQGYIAPDCEIKHAQVGDFEIAYACEDTYGSNWRYGIWYMELPDGFSIRGTYENEHEVMPVSLPDAIGLVLGEDVQLAEAKTEEELANADAQPEAEKTLDEIAASYGYQTPAELGATVNTATYRIDGVVYQFPTPVSVFLQNGWKIPDHYTAMDDKIYAGNPIQVALTNENGGVIYNVLLSNPTTEESVPLEEGMIVMMMVTHTSNVDFELPEGITFNSTLDDLKNMASAEYVDYLDNAPYSTFAWWNKDLACEVRAWYHPEIGIEYFEFMQY